jgi:site-specific DNA recombinase
MQPTAAGNRDGMPGRPWSPEEATLARCDVGPAASADCTRRVRKQAAVAPAVDPGREASGFDAIVVGEYERAFVGGQLRNLLPMLERLGVELWLPETGGPVEKADPRPTRHC